MRSRLLTVLSLATVALAALSASASAADRYVSPVWGGGAFDCTSVEDACDLAALNSASAVQDGDVVHMLGGSHVAPVGWITKRLSIVGPTSGTPATITTPLRLNVNAGTQPVRFEDFTVDATTSESIMSALTYYDSAGTGAATFERLNLHLASPHSSYGLTVYFAGADVTVRNSVLSASNTGAGGSAGLLVEAAWNSTAAALISNVTAVAGEGGLVLPRSSSSGGTCGTATITIRNSIIRALSTPDDIVAFPPAMGDCYPSVTSRHSSWRTVLPSSEAFRVTSIEDQRSMDPVFVNAGTRDFREADSSPTIDRGEVASSLGLLDLVGAARVIGPKPDIGAYERTGGTYPWPIEPGPGSGTPGPPDTKAPIGSALKLSPSKFAATKKTKKGSKVSYSLSEAATVTWTVSIKKKKPKKGYKSVKGSIKMTGKAGANSFKFLGYVGKTKLKPGAYLLSGVAVDSAGNKSKAFSKTFTIKK